MPTLFKNKSCSSSKRTAQPICSPISKRDASVKQESSSYMQGENLVLIYFTFTNLAFVSLHVFCYIPWMSGNNTNVNKKPVSFLESFGNKSSGKRKDFVRYANNMLLFSFLDFQ
uniref:Uncharacterized protein n=1 Tax=Micrurus lemniscatus lemniscatus TaxID=129467 RepID=A0A2D4JDZ3_MICLE